MFMMCLVCGTAEENNLIDTNYKYLKLHFAE